MNDGLSPQIPISQFDYDLPQKLIAQQPVEPRDSSRLLHVAKNASTFQDHIFRDLPEMLNPNDVLVLNDTRVIPARIFARRPSGGRVEFLLLSQLDGDIWRGIARPARKLRPGEPLTIVDTNGTPTSRGINIIERESTGEFVVRIDDADATIHAYGQVPLPPYIDNALANPERYQTVYSDQEGSVAAPTAGLHFTPELLSRCITRGIGVLYVTLHVGLDTFQPVKVENALDHQIHSERYSVGAETVVALRNARQAGKRIIAVGTTAARTLETIAAEIETGEALSGQTSIYITPGYQFKLVDGLVTNFHLPRTTLLLMVSALAGEHTIKRAYEHAIRTRYRFYSFGDAMLIV